MNINTEITLNDIREILLKYSFENNEKYYYYSRKNNIWNLMYDHFFKRLYHIFSDVSLTDDDEWVKEFIKAIKYCNTDYLYDIFDVKANLNFSERNYRITNFYNVILYEIYVNKIFKQLAYLSHKNNLTNYLILDKYFWYFSSVNYSIDSENNISSLDYQHYDVNWILFEEKKKELLKGNNEYIETDIKWFYDNINHEILIEKLKYIFHKYWNENIDNFLYIFSNILYKVNWYKKSWIPQWVIASDIIANLFIWLILFNDKDLYDFKQENWFYSLYWLKCINYNDDFIFCGNNLDTIFNKEIKKIFKNNSLTLSLEKTTWILDSFSYKFYDEIDYNKIISNDKIEITKLKNLFITELEKNIDKIDIKLLKRNFKWIHNIKSAKPTVKKSFVKWIFKILFEDIDWKKKYEKIKKIYLLLVISPSNFVYLIIILEEFFQEKYNKSFEKLLLQKIFIHYNYYVTDSLLVKFYSDLNNSYHNLGYKELKSFLFNLINKNNNKAIKSFLDNDKKPLDLIIKDNGLIWLHNLIYGNNDIKRFKENILWIKLYSLFWININYDNINSFFERNWNDKIIKNVKLKLNHIIDDLIIIKNISPNFYLKNPSFIADLYSVLNILLTLLFFIIDNKIIEVKIDWGNEEGFIQTKKDKIENKFIKVWLRKYINDFDTNHISMLYYIAKKRAIYNHKEIDIDKDINFLVYKKNNDLNTFYNWISSLIIYILNLIDKEVLSNKI